MKTIPDTGSSAHYLLGEEGLCESRGEIDTVLAQPKVEIGKLSVEQVKLLTTLESQYFHMVTALKKYGLISHDDRITSSLPSWERMKDRLTATVLEKACKLDEPALVMVPPVGRRTMIEAIDSRHEAQGREDATHIHELGNDALWNGGKLETTNDWEVAIVTGVQCIKADETIKGTSYQRTKAWLMKYSDQGIDVMNDARTYLVLMMASLVADKPIDKEFWTVLNAKNCTETYIVVHGCWCHHRVYLDGVNPMLDLPSLRLRGLVRVI